MKHEDARIIEILSSEAREYIEAASQHTLNKKLSTVLHDTAMRCISEVHKILDKFPSNDSISREDAKSLKSTLIMMNSMILSKESYTENSTLYYHKAISTLNRYIYNYEKLAKNTQDAIHKKEMGYILDKKTANKTLTAADTLRIAGVNYRVDKNGRILFKDYSNIEAKTPSELDEDSRDNNKYKGNQADTVFYDDLYDMGE